MHNTPRPHTHPLTLSPHTRHTLLPTQSVPLTLHDPNGKVPSRLMRPEEGTQRKKREKRKFSMPILTCLSSRLELCMQLGTRL